MDVLKVFEELDALVRPSQAAQQDPTTTKTFKLNVERFLQHAKPQLSWSHTFHERMLKTLNILSQEKYTQYVEAMKWYIENSEGSSITKTQRMCVTLANNLLEFLQVHKMDPDSALIGLSPSNNTFDSCTELERHLPHQIVVWKGLDGSGVKQEVRKTAEKVKDTTTISKGDLLIIRRSRGEQGLVYARYSGEKSQTQGIGSSISVWMVESIIERVPLNQVYFINSYTKQTILSRDEHAISKAILNPAPIFFRKLDAHAQAMTYKYLMSLGIEWSLIRSFDSNSLYMQHVQSGNMELEKLAKVKQILITLLTEEADGEGRRLHKFVSKVDFAFDSLCLQYLGRKKDELNDRILLHIEHETNFFLESLGFDFTAVPDNYIEHPPSSLAVVAKNLSLLKSLLIKGSPMYSLATRVCGEIGVFVFSFLRNCYIAILSSLGRLVPLDSLPDDSQQYIKHLSDIIAEIKGQAAPNIMREKYRHSQNITELKLTMSISDDKIRKCSSLISELEVLFKMTIEHEIKEKNVNDVTFGGLVINVFVRLSEEMKTVLEHWDKKENSESKLDGAKAKGGSKVDLKHDSSGQLSSNPSSPSTPSPSVPQSPALQSSQSMPSQQALQDKSIKRERDINNAVGNWVAARRTHQSAKNLGEFNKKVRGGSDLSLSGEESESPKENGREDTIAAARSENGKDDGPAHAGDAVPHISLSQSEEISPPQHDAHAVVKSVSFHDLSRTKQECDGTPGTGTGAGTEPGTGTATRTVRTKTEIVSPRLVGEDGSEVGGSLSLAPKRALPPVPQHKLRPEPASHKLDVVKPDTTNKPEAANHKPEAANHKPEATNPKPETTPKLEPSNPNKNETSNKHDSTNKLDAYKIEPPHRVDKDDKRKSDDRVKPDEKPDAQPRLDKSASKKSANLLTLRDKGRTTMRTFNIFGSKETPKLPPAPVDPLQLQVAATQNHVNLAYELISQGTHDINIQDKQGWTALHCAAHNVASVHGIDANIPNDSQATPLHILSKTTSGAFSDMSTFLSALDLMMIKGASLTTPNSQGEIPLHLATLSGNTEVVRFLLKSGSDPNALTNSHQSCLHYATHRGNADVVRLLLEYGANPNYEAPDVGTPLTIAKQNKLEEISQLLCSAVG